MPGRTAIIVFQGFFPGLSQVTKTPLTIYRFVMNTVIALLIILVQLTIGICPLTDLHGFLGIFSMSKVVIHPHEVFDFAHPEWMSWFVFFHCNYPYRGQGSESLIEFGPSDPDQTRVSKRNFSSPGLVVL